MDNIVFYFSGTGNSLKVAKTLGKELENTEIISMARPGKYALTKEYETIGFVYPTYFCGLPKKVIDFLENLDLGNNEDAYYYSIATHGGAAVNAVYQIYELLHKRHGITMNYCQSLEMFPNYVPMYDMKQNVTEILKKSDEKLVPIITSIKNKENNKAKRLPIILYKIFELYSKRFLRTVSNEDRNFTTGDNCTGCGICEKVCPVKNIEITSGKPKFNHTCEQCLACIQYCPQKAINYKNKTQNRRRYTHPEIDYNEISRHNSL